MNLPTKWVKADSCSYHKNPACQEKFLTSGAFITYFQTDEIKTIIVESFSKQ